MYACACREKGGVGTHASASWQSASGLHKRSGSASSIELENEESDAPDLTINEDFHYFQGYEGAVTKIPYPCCTHTEA